jgi:hypothetical protein
MSASRVGEDPDVPEIATEPHDLVQTLRPSAVRRIRHGFVPHHFRSAHRSITLGLQNAPRRSRRGLGSLPSATICVTRWCVTPR